MSLIGFGGFGGGFDDNLSAKVDKLLAGKRSAEQKRNDFLEEHGIDPESLPLNRKGALMAINKALSDLDMSAMRLLGNSLGLARVELLPPVDEDDPNCPQCNSYDTFLHAGPRTWQCEDCGNRFTLPNPEQNATTVKPDPTSHDWRQYVRIYTALVKEEWVIETPVAEDKPAKPAKFLMIAEEPVKPPAPMEPQRTFVCFQATKSWGAEATVDPLPTPAPRWKRPEKYPTGSVLRITNKDSGAQEYVRVGGPFSDTDLVILGTMEPISKASDWTVTEVLET